MGVAGAEPGSGGVDPDSLRPGWPRRPPTGRTIPFAPFQEGSFLLHAWQFLSFNSTAASPKAPVHSGAETTIDRSSRPQALGVNPGPATRRSSMGSFLL